MARHIDADKLLENLETFAPEHCTDLIKMLILKQPTEDVVEVVRCKDCEHSHWEQEPCHGKTEYYCTKLKSKVDSHFYCGCGQAIDWSEENVH